jgi:predicted MFS family arabinose efflux permease
MSSTTPAAITAATTTPLRDPKLRRIVVAYTINRLGTWFGYIALSLAVYQHTHSALAVAALLVTGQALPAFLVPAVVARIEASSRRGELSGLYLFEAAAFAALAALLSWYFSLPGILLLAALDGAAALAASALLRAAVARCAREWAHHAHREDGPLSPEHLPAHTYAGRVGRAPVVGEQGIEADWSDAREAGAVEAERKANAVLNIAFSGTLVTGPALAGVVVATAGAPVALLIDVASFLICGAMLIDLHPHVEELGGASVRAQLRAAWEHINDVAALRMLLLTEGFALIFFASDGSIEVPYAKVALQVGDRGYGALLAVWGLGVVVGSVTFARVVKRSLVAILSVGTLAVGLAYLGWALAPSLAVACAAGLVGGIGNGMQWAAFISAVQRLTPQSLHGRMMGAVESLGAICPAIGLALGGVLVAVSSPRTAFFVVGLVAALSTIAFVRLRLEAPSGSIPAPGAAHVEPEWAPVSADSPDSA